MTSIKDIVNWLEHQPTFQERETIFHYLEGLLPTLPNNDQNLALGLMTIVSFRQPSWIAISYLLDKVELSATDLLSTFDADWQRVFLEIKEKYLNIRGRRAICRRCSKDVQSSEELTQLRRGGFFDSFICEDCLYIVRF